jgi:DNA-binding transcriptional MerR regulator
MGPSMLLPPRAPEQAQLQAETLELCSCRRRAAIMPSEYMIKLRAGFLLKKIFNFVLVLAIMEFSMVKKNIGQLSEETGFSIQTIRYYESLGLLPAPDRSDSGYRKYDESYSQHINFIKNAKNMGFSLDEIKELIYLKSSNDALGKDVKHMVKLKMEELAKQIKELENTYNYLASLNQSCSGKMQTKNCPILKQLSD